MARLGWIAALAIIVGAAYTFVIARQAPEQMWPWLHGAVATVLSVLLGVVAGFWLYDRQQATTDARELTSLRILIQREFSDVNGILTGNEVVVIPVELDKAQRSVVVSYLQPLAIEKAAGSGQFSPLDTAYLLRLAESIRSYNLAIQLLFTSLASSKSDLDYPYRLKFAVDNIEKKRAGIAGEVERLSKRLDLPLVGWSE